MMGRSHAATGAAAVVLVAPHQPWPVLVATATVGAAAALLPDLDIESSLVSNCLGPITRLISRGVAWAAGGHRMGTHSLSVLILVASAASALWTPHHWLPIPYGNAIAMGYAVHLLGDYFTGPGIALLWPWTHRRFGLPIFGNTGGWREHAAVVVTVAGAAYVALAA